MAFHPETAVYVSASFDEVADAYDARFTNSAIGLAQRRFVWKEIDQTFRSGQRILEINCGTGVDALHLASQGIEVVACDSSPAMIAVAQRQSAVGGSRAPVDFRVLATEQIGTLHSEGSFDGILSNFAGLNCIPGFAAMAGDLARLVKPGSKAILCLFGRFCLWETVWYLTHGNSRDALRRFGRTSVEAALSRHSKVKVWYPSTKQVAQQLSPHFHLRTWKGVGITVPPSYLESLAERNPRLFRVASAIDPWLGKCPGLRAVADHMLLTFERAEI